MNTSEKHPLSKRTFNSLMEKRDLYCVSIYLPMDKMGKEQNQRLAQAHLKTCIRDVKNALTMHQMHADDIQDYLRPVEKLLVKSELWRNPSDGLAIFLDPERGMRHFKIPISFEIKTYVAGHFYLVPLLPLYQNNGTYYLLELSQDYVQLYEASRYHFKKLHLADVAPEKLEEAVGYDYKQKTLQFRSGQGGFNAQYHGHGDGKEDKKNELLRYFRLLDSGVNDCIKDRKAPLVLSCSEGQYALYAKANSYPNLYGSHVSGDPEYYSDTQRHQDSWALVAPYFKKSQTEQLKEFNANYQTRKTSYEINSLVPAALNGNIKSLFIQTGSDVFGTYDQDNHEVLIDQNHQVGNVSLTNLVALQTFAQGGNVYFLSPDEMPVKGSTMNVIFRF